MRIALAQIAPVLLDRQATLDKVCLAMEDAADNGASLVTFGETLVPAYPVWLCRTDGAAFDDPRQKRWHARYLKQGVDLHAGQLDAVIARAGALDLTVVLGVAERSGHTLYCSAVTLNGDGIQNVHRKLKPTYEERLCWGAGDGHGLRVQALGEFTLSALNCWENWMPMARTALYAQGADLHVALWPGCERLTRDITRFIAKESRSWVLSVSGLIREQDIADDELREALTGAGMMYDGGSCIAAPDGSWLVEPVVGEERVIVADIDAARVREERQNFDPTGHYSRPDVLKLSVDRRRQHNAQFED